MSDLRTTKGTLAYLQNTAYAASGIQLLSGGYSAFTYRITLQSPLPTGEKTLILKHYEGYLSDYELKLSPERGEFEYKALLAVATSNLFDSDSTVQTPRPVHYDPKTHTVFMTDLGSPVTLGLALTESPEMAVEIGAALGAFMGRFHNWGAAPEQAELRNACSHNAVVNCRNHFDVRFDLLMQSVERFGLGEKWIEELAAKWREVGLARSDEEVLAVGDLWLDNVLVSMPDATHGLRVYIIDWEMVLPTYAEYDMGEFVGTALRLGRELYPQGDDQFVSAILEAYGAHRTLNPTRMAIDTGTFAASYGVAFAKPDDPLVRDTLLTGLELAWLGLAGDKCGIRQSLLRGLFRPIGQAGGRCELEGCGGGCATERIVTFNN